MNDLFGREKFGHLPRSLSENGKRSRTYEVGELVYWSPGPDVAIFYRHDGQEIPPPGIVVNGEIDSGVEAFEVRSRVRVRIEPWPSDGDAQRTPHLPHSMFRPWRPKNPRNRNVEEPAS